MLALLLDPVGDVEEGIEVLELRLQGRLHVDRFHPTVAPLLETATLKHGELPSLHAAHGIVAPNPAVVVQPLVLLCHRGHLVDDPSNAAPPVNLYPTVRIPTQQIGTAEARHAMRGASIGFLREAKDSRKFRLLTATPAREGQLLNSLESLFVRQARGGGRKIDDVSSSTLAEETPLYLEESSPNFSAVMPGNVPLMGSHRQEIGGRI